jgi:host factor-I protein
MSKSQANLQDHFLNQTRKDNIPVTVYLVSGVQLRGIVRGFDPFTVVLESPGKPAQLVYKHAIASVVPARPVRDLTVHPDYSPGEQAEQTEGETAPAAEAPAVTEE